MKLRSQLDTNYRSIDEVRQFVRSIETVYMLDRPIAGDSDRREHERYNITMPVTVTPLPRDSQSLSVQHHGISRDICCNGIGLVATDPVRPGEVLLTIEPCRGENFDVVARITYCNDVGFYFQIGCEFLCSQQCG